MIQITNIHVKVTPQVDLALEAVYVGKIDAREAFTDLVMDAEILVDDAELQKIKGVPDVQQALGNVVSTQPTYKPTDWRAKGSEMRTAQWKQKPVIDYIANTYKDAVLKAIAQTMASLPEQWRHALLAKPTYRLDPKALQLSPTNDKKYKSIFVQVVLPLGSYETGDGFLGKLSQEFDQAVASNQVQEAADGLVWQSSLSGLETFFRKLDPFAGIKPEHHYFARGLHGVERPGETSAIPDTEKTYVARWGEKPHEADPGYDAHVKEGMLSQMQNALDNKLVEAMGVSVASMKVSDDGVFVFKANPPEPATEPEQVADKMEPEEPKPEV